MRFLGACFGFGFGFRASSLGFRDFKVVGS